MAVTVVPHPTFSMSKDDLFYVLVRLVQLIEDADPLCAVTDEDILVRPELDNEEGNGEAPTNHFGHLFDAVDALTQDVVGEYMGLFAILSSPLNRDPQLMSEFQDYAREHYGSEIQFTQTSMVSSEKKSSLHVVPKDTDHDGNDTSPKK